MASIIGNIHYPKISISSLGISIIRRKRKLLSQRYYDSSIQSNFSYRAYLSNHIACTLSQMAQQATIHSVIKGKAYYQGVYALPVLSESNIYTNQLNLNYQMMALKNKKRASVHFNLRTKDYDENNEMPSLIPKNRYDDAYNQFSLINQKIKDAIHKGTYIICKSKPMKLQNRNYRSSIALIAPLTFSQNIKNKIKLPIINTVNEVTENPDKPVKKIHITSVSKIRFKNIRHKNHTHDKIQPNILLTDLVKSATNKLIEDYGNKH
jgi:hypothetical protein